MFFFLGPWDPGTRKEIECEFCPWHADDDYDEMG